MASGKLSPRQKMINMMYLVLTALLALQVSAEIIESFQQIADSLRAFESTMADKNNKLGGDIQSTIKSNRGTNATSSDDKFIPMVDTIRARTAKVIGGIEAMREGLFAEEVAGTRDGFEPTDPNKQLLNKGEDSKNYRYWMGDGQAGVDETANDGRGAGKAIELRQLLNDYAAWANNYYLVINPKDSSALKGVPKFEKIALDPAEDTKRFPDTPQFREVRGKKWENYTFKGMPAVANLAILEMYKAQIRVIEAELLQAIRSQLSKFEFKVDSLVLVVAPKSEIVVAGMTFEANMFVAATSKEAVPVFSGPGLKVNPDGQSATLKIPARANFGDKADVIEQAYSASVTVTKADGSKAELPFRGKFKVQKPVLRTRSKVVNSVYLNCANQTYIECPALGELYNPVFKGVGGNVQPSKEDKTSVMLLPTNPKQMQVQVSSNTNGQVIPLGDLTFTVIKPPRPMILFFVNGKEVQPSQPIASTSSVRLRVVPDKEFAERLPRDARYKIKGIRVLLMRGIALQARPIDNVRGAGPDNNVFVDVNLGGYGLKKGDQLFFEVDGVVRTNYANQDFEEEFTKRELTTVVNVN